MKNLNTGTSEFNLGMFSKDESNDVLTFHFVYNIYIDEYVICNTIFLSVISFFTSFHCDS